MKARLSRVIAAPVAAIALAAAFGAATVPGASASIRPACGWQSLYLQNGWQSADSAWNSGDPVYCVDNGVVYLGGSLTQPTAGPDEFAKLPPQALPTSSLYLSVYTYEGSPGTLHIGSDGSMSVWDDDIPGRAGEFTSLAGISFPLAGTSLQQLPLNPAWQSAGSTWNTGDPSYVIGNGIVHLAGSATITDITNPATWFLQIPNAMAPDRCVETNVYTFGSTVGTLLANQTDDMYFETGGDLSDQVKYISLAGVAYPAHGAIWTPLNLQTGWTTGVGDCQTGWMPSYTVIDHIVYLSGAVIKSQPGASTLIGTLPATARPQHDLFLTVSTGQNALGALHITPAGLMFVSGGATQTSLTSLSGISFQTSS